MSLDEKPPFDYPTEMAKAVVVDNILFQLGSDGERVSEMWEDYPEIGERDWIAICQAVKRVTEKRNPSQDAFRAAYTHLASRAEHGDGGGDLG